MSEQSGRLESDRLDSIRLFQDSVHWEGKVFDVKQFICVDLKLEGDA